MRAHQLLRFGETLPQSSDSQFIIFDAQNNGIALSDTKRAAEGRGDNNPPVFVDAGMTLIDIHDIIYDMSLIT